MLFLLSFSIFIKEEESVDSKKAYILVEDMYEDQEFWYPYYRLKEAGYEVAVVGPEKKTEYTSKHGYPVTSDVTPSRVKASNVDVLVVPGGYAPDKLRRYREVLDLVREADENGAVVATICHGAWVLISAGITKGKKMTCVSAIKDDLENSGAEYEDAPLVVDGKLVTSRFPDDLPQFLEGILKAVG